MSVFSSSGPIEDLNSGGPQAGPVQVTVRQVELRTSQKGAQYVNVVLTDDNDRDIYVNLFPNSKPKDPSQSLDSFYPYRFIKNFLTVAGFYNNGSVDLPSWDALKGRQLQLICQLDDYTKRDGSTVKIRVPHSYYTANFLSAKEFADGATEASSFVKNVEYVKNNPNVPHKNDTTANSGDEPF